MSTPANKTTAETFYNINARDMKVYVEGTVVPTATTAGYEKGCIFVKLDAATGVSGIYVNNGTSASCVFELSTSSTSASPTQGIGYATGSGGTVTQITSRSTGVTLSKINGYIQTDTTSLAAGAIATFTVTNTTVAIGDVVIVAIRSGTTTAFTTARVSAVAAGSFDITVHNTHASTAETGAIRINFAVIKAVSA